MIERSRPILTKRRFICVSTVTLVSLILTIGLPALISGFIKQGILGDVVINSPQADGFRQFVNTSKDGTFEILTSFKPLNLSQVIIFWSFTFSTSQILTRFWLAINLKLKSSVHGFIARIKFAPTSIGPKSMTLCRIGRTHGSPLMQSRRRIDLDSPTTWFQS